MADEESFLKDNKSIAAPTAAAVEDAGKKRDCTEVVKGDKYNNMIKEKTKKRRARCTATGGRTRPSSPSSSSSSSSQGAAAEFSKSFLSISRDNNESALPRSSSTSVSTKNVKSNPESADTVNCFEDDCLVKAHQQQVWDLHSGLHHLVQMTGDEKEDREYLSKDTWVNFRVGHGGDSSALAAFYRKFSTANGNKSCRPGFPEDTSLEVWLADGLGDEDNPPSVYALLAEIKPKTRLGAAALITLGWEDGCRALIVEWLAIDHDVEAFEILEKRLWLRLSTLSIMTSCEIMVTAAPLGATKTAA